MQFLKSTLVLVATFVAVAFAVPSKEPPCKPILQSCSANSECCSDLCSAGVSNDSIFSFPSADLLFNSFVAERPIGNESRSINWCALQL